MERLLNTKKNYNDEVVLAVLSIIHELVYFTIHSAIQEKKSGLSAPEQAAAVAEEKDNILYRFGGVALNKMIKLKETLKSFQTVKKPYN